MGQKIFWRNLTGTACALGLAFSVNVNSTMLINEDGNVKMPKANQTFLHETTSNSRMGGISTESNIYVQQSLGKLEEETRSLFGTMRDATSQEQQAVSDYLSNIAIDTGVNFFDIC